MTPEDAHPPPDLLAACALDALAPAEGQDVRAHVKGCAGCRTEIDRFRLVITLIGAEDASPPPGLWARIQAAINTCAGPTDSSGIITGTE